MKKFETIKSAAEEKLEKYLNEKKGNWATMLSYMVSRDIDNPIELANTHLSIILEDIIDFIKNG